MYLYIYMCMCINMQTHALAITCMCMIVHCKDLYIHTCVMHAYMNTCVRTYVGR